MSFSTLMDHITRNGYDESVEPALDIKVSDQGKAAGIYGIVPIFHLLLFGLSFA